jgi:sterol desaturase/sphingolipid hydroxylase (fatty acid hydroxylase superfamily)
MRGPVTVLRLARVGAVVVLANVGALVVLSAVWPSAVRRVLDVFRASIDTLTSGAMNYYLATLVFVLVAEAFVLGWRHCSIRGLMASDRSARLDLAWGLVSAFGLMDALVLLVSLGTFAAFAPLLSIPLRAVGLLGVAQGLPMPVQVIAYFVLYDFVSYWYHRWCHRSKRLWRLHRYHHESTTFLVLTGDRVHPGELAIRQWLMLMPLLVLGTPAVIPPIVWMVRAAVDLLQHSMLPWTYGVLGRWVVFSPVGHRIHHSPMSEHRGRNLGDILTIWDRLFGTWYEGAVINPHVGLSVPAETRRTLTV